MPPRNLPSREIIKLQRDLADIKEHLPDVEVTFPNPDKHTEFEVAFPVYQGIYHGGKFVFKFAIPEDWPIRRPRVTCQTKVWHPDISEEGLVSLDILRDCYSPTVNISQIIVGIQFLFAEPNFNSPLNVIAADQYLKNPTAFQAKVQEYIKNYCHN